MPYLGIHDIRRDIGIRNVLAKLASELALDFLEIEGLQARPGSAINPGLVSDDLGAQRLWETADRLTKISLEELHDGGREVKSFSALKDILLGEPVGHHPLCEVADNFGRWRDLDDVSALYDRNRFFRRALVCNK